MGDLDGRVEQAFLVGLALRSQTGGWDGAWSGLCEVGPDGLGGVGVGAAEEWETGHWEDGCSMRGEGERGLGEAGEGGEVKEKFTIQKNSRIKVLICS